MRMWAKLDQLVDVLRDAGVMADTDATKLSLPAVWIAARDYTPAATLGCDGWAVSVVMIANDTDHKRSRQQLAALWADVSAVLEPDSALRARTVTVAAGGAPMPALVFDLNI